MPPSTPYSHFLGDREPIPSMRESSKRIRAVTAAWTRDQFERSYAPGKWTARQIVTHLAQTELALGTRARMALSTPNYMAQPFDQDAWIARETRLTGEEASAAFGAIVAMNLALFESLSPADRQTPMTHPEYGSITVDWIVYLLAGHQINHLNQLEQIAEG